MKNIANYQITDTLYKSDKTSVFLASNEENDQFVLKTTTNPYPSPEELKRFEREFKISQDLEMPGIPKALSLIPQGNSLAILQEYIAAPTLGNVIKTQKLSVRQVLQIAIYLASTLEKVHKKNVIHKDLNCNNILLNPETYQPTIIDFDIATQLSTEKTDIGNVNNLQGTLPYISPEQTGRMNRSIDYRTDLYSFGVVLYEMLTGNLPFQGKEQMEIIHAHIALKPKPPHLINSEIPPFLSEIVLKLLSKNAEDRYQSAKGLKSDLSDCLENLDNNNAHQLVLGKGDYSDKFQISQKLYGREQEREKLLSAFDKTCEEGNAQLVLIKGYSGIGKSVLIQEIQKPITQKNGYYIKGKFEQFQRNIPYLAIIQAFDVLIDHILTESQQKLTKWKNDLLTALEGNGQVMVDVIPKLELIIGEQAPVEKLPSTETQNRFNYTFENFIKVFTQKEHPIMLVIDDLQWADNASLQLLELFLKNAQNQYLFIVGSYRDNEVDQTHPLTATLKEISKYAEIQSIALSNLRIEHIQSIVADTLKTDIESTESLAQLIFNKTEGNPFFINQFLTSLYQDGLLFFDYTHYQWQWNDAKIKSQDMTDNVVELLVKKIEKLPAQTIDLLKVAAAFNNQFDKEALLAFYPESSLEEIETALNEALKEQLILSNQKGYKFQHDRIQQASYSLIAPENIAQVHLNIGQTLLDNTPEELLEQEVFSVVNQLNKAQSLITTPASIDKLRQLNFKAAQKATSATAYNSAINYLNTAYDLLPTAPWENLYDFTFLLHKELIEAEYLNGNFDKVEEYAQSTLQNAHTSVEKADIYNTLIIQATLQAKYTEAIEAGKKALELLDFGIPADTDLEAAIGAGFGAVAQHLGERKVSSIVDAPDAEVAEDILVAKILSNMASPAYLSNPNLWTFIIVQATALGLKKGNVPELSTIYSSYGILCGVVFSDYTTGYEYGELAYKLSEKYNNLQQKCNSCFVLGSFLIYPVKPAHHIMPVLKEGEQLGFQSGELQFATYNTMIAPNVSFIKGDDIQTFIEHSEANLYISLKYQNSFATDIILPMYGLANALSDSVYTPPNHLPQEFDTILELTTKNQTFVSIYMSHLYQAIAYLVMNDTNNAIKSTNEALNWLPYNVGNAQYMSTQFYYPLIQLQQVKQMPDKKEEVLNQIKDFIDKLKLLSELNPADFHNKYLLIKAEIAQIKGEHLEAMDYYEEAINKGQAQGLTFENAIAAQMAALFYESINKHRIAQVYWQQSHQAYNIWGASKKVSQLEQMYPFLLKGNTGYKDSQTIVTTTGKSGNIGKKLNFDTILKASQMLSEEVVLSSLLEKMMATLIENSGAQRGFLFLYNQDQPYLEAAVDVSTQAITTLQSIPLEQVNAQEVILSEEIVNYVVRTKQTLVLNDASNEGQFTHLPYISTTHTKSLLCTPLLKTGHIVGILYLENNLSTGAFTSQHLEVLNILSSQMAISVENALLYENLEDKVKERTKQLNIAYQQIKQKNDDITASINYGQRIQAAILPNTQRIKSILDDCFILFKPRDIVSGDFYWFNQKDDKVIIAAIDCTGHGVPGAFMSMIGHALLSEIVSVKNIVTPSQVLTQLDKGIQALLKQDKTKNRDGMDLALCVWDKTNKVLTFAGAKNPLVYIQNNTIHAIKGNKFSIGGEVRKTEVTFEEHSINIDAPTCCYIASDGYQDQFGGQEDKKFMRKRLKNLLLDIHSQDMDSQKNILDQTLQEWTGAKHQTDDVLVIGFKVE
ncbi:AAA family ATPase [Microscilla marina]|uniref:Serine/threonine protein kinases n=1 Tax=Microscilla marina ATCC 23134 TaxID=313606 RepID=A1ZQI8_MICM2|nr:AAA family ATPase [Microscilla marina]EAY27360.1 serine/threonine protein kinases [Microscilla marina ATCC 23134]